MIPPIDTILPELEAAVRSRTESATLLTMHQEDLRSLVYSLVERQQQTVVDPTGHFSHLVDRARGRHRDMMLAKDESIRIRIEVLNKLLHVLHPAIPSLLSPLPVCESHAPGTDPKREYHPFLAGYQLVDGLRTSTKQDQAIFTGTSWWIVGIIPEHPELGTGVRYARADHRGSLADGEGGPITDYELVTSNVAAQKIRDIEFRPILETLHARLEALSGDRVSASAENLSKVARRLRDALDAMG